jgi:formylglycine-generating enzyme required for sulfatase activity
LKEGYQVTERNDGTLVANLGSVAMEFVPIPAGSFMMGGEENEFWKWPLHRVTISKPFYMGKYEVTQAQWQDVMGSNPSGFKNCGGNCPVEQVTWFAVQEFIKRLNARNNGYTFRLPTEAEWEYSARAGTTKNYGGTGKLDEMGWYQENSTHQVGTKQPNTWGLFDMHDNVAEWCEDWYADYKSSPVTDPQGPSDGPGRVLRGGSWIAGSEFCRAAARSNNWPGNSDWNTGFRLVAVR